MITPDLLRCLADDAAASGQREVAVILHTLADSLTTEDEGLREFAKLSYEFSKRELKRIRAILAAESN